MTDAGWPQTSHPVQVLFDWWSQNQWVDVAGALARALLVAVLAWQVARLARYSFDRATLTSGADANIRLLVGRVLFLVIVGVGIVTVLDIVGIPLSAVVTVMGVAGLAIGLAVQDILKSFFAGLYLLFERPFRLGDEIQLKEYRGVVEHVDYRTTMIRTEENIQVLIPNALLFAEIVLNRREFRPLPEPAAEQAEGAQRGRPAGQ